MSIEAWNAITAEGIGFVAGLGMAFCIYIVARATRENHDDGG